MRIKSRRCGEVGAVNNDLVQCHICIKVYRGNKNPLILWSNELEPK